MKQGPRIYNLFPSLAGSIDRWIEHVPRIAAMQFNWIYVNPFHETGYSGSLYAVKSYERLNPLFRGKSRRSDDALIRDFVEQAAQAGLGVMMDLVVNHTARDADLVSAHQEWYRRDAAGEINAFVNRCVHRGNHNLAYITFCHRQCFHISNSCC